MGTQLEHHGNSNTQSFGTDISISRKRAWVHQLTATTTSLSVRLPDARYLMPGIMVIQIVVHPDSEDFEIQDNDGGTLIATATASDVYTFHLFDNSTAAGDWEWGEYTLNSTGAPPATIFPTTMGGVDAGMINDAWKFDFVTDTWSESPNDSTSTYADGGGARISGTGFVGNVTLDHEQYDPPSWFIKTDHTDDRNFTPGKELSTGDDRAYYFGTSSTGGVANRDLTDEYDLSGDAFTAFSDMLEGRWKCRAERKDTDFILMGGSTTFTATHNTTADVRQFDQVADSHSALTDMTNIRRTHASAQTGDDEPIVYCGETAAGVRRDDVEQYDPVGDSWSAMNDYPNGDSARFGATHIAANHRNYGIGGEGGTNGDATYEHIPLSDTYNAKTDHAAAETTARGNQHSTQSLTD